MTTAANPRGDDPTDAEALARYAADLGDAVAVALPRWVQRAVATRWDQWKGEPLPPELDDAAREAADAAAAAVIDPLRTLLATDVAEQPTNPLEILRRAVEFPTRVLASTGMPEVARDADARRLFPDDRYDLTPGSFADIDPELHEPGLHWGAAKASILLSRRR
ncbi:MAG: hypothetical protein M3Z03_14570 [Actinomycetota bacterium]|nr:hypothetical protein [Actinomycetota bacterium]